MIKTSCVGTNRHWRKISIVLPNQMCFCVCWIFQICLDKVNNLSNKDYRQNQKAQEIKSLKWIDRHFVTFIASHFKFKFLFTNINFWKWLILSNLLIILFDRFASRFYNLKLIISFFTYSYMFVVYLCYKYLFMCFTYVLVRTDI